MNKPLVIISGATATGKTSTSLFLSSELKKKGIHNAIINFDSLIFYKELSIGTAKPTSKELAQAEHFLIDICSAKNSVNASDYINKALPIIEKLHEQNRVPILVGGSGFYLRALIKGMYGGEPTTPEIRKRAEDLFKKKGISPFREILKENDPQSFKDLHENDHYRIIRAVEFWWSSGLSFSQQKEKISDPYDFSSPINPDWKIIHHYLDVPKDDHYKIICKRTDSMIEDGLVEEVKHLLNTGFSGEEKPLQSIGYKETLEYLNGNFENETIFKERISISTRQLAKAQRTWFKKIVNKNCFNSLEESFKKQILTETLSQLLR